MRKVLFLLVTLALSVGVYAQSNTYKDGGKCSIASPDFVKEKLNYPKTAKFNKSHVHEENGYQKAIVIAKLTAKNAFGVESEYVYKIWMTHNGGDWTEKENWKMTKMILENASTGEQKIYTK